MSFYPSCGRGIECAVSGQCVVVNHEPQARPRSPLAWRVSRGARKARSQEIAYGRALVCDKDSEQRACDCEQTHRVCAEGIHAPSVGALLHYILGGCGSQGVCMFVWGTANPPGESDAYNGLFLTDADIKGVVHDQSLNGLPVKIEHKGIQVGKVVTAWNNNGKLDLLIDVDERVLEGDVVSRFVRNKVCNDLSLGYTVGLQYSEAAKTYTPSKKTFNEVSIVRTGAREKCHIHGYSVDDTSKKRGV